MEAWNELRMLERKLAELKRKNHQLYGSLVELKVRQLLMHDRLDEMRRRNEELLTLNREHNQNLRAQIKLNSGSGV